MHALVQSEFGSEKEMEHQYAQTSSVKVPTIFLSFTFILEDLSIVFVQVAVVRRTLIQKLLVEREDLIFLLLLVFPTLEELFDSWKILCATKVPDIDSSSVSSK